MKKSSVILFGMALFGTSCSIIAQETTTTTTTTVTVSPDTKAGDVSKSLGYYIMANNGQDAETQLNDEVECYQWAIDQSGYDPKNPTVVQAAQVDQSARGSAIKGAAKGAAVGAAVGSISGDAGDGAAYGAIAGGLRSRRGAKQQAQAQQQANNQAAEEKKAAMLADYKKAYTLCLESKGYSLK